MAETPSSKYDAVAMTLHWLMAALITAVAVIGLLFDLMDRETKLVWVNIHNCLGLAVLVLAVGRIVWRLTHRPPDLPATIDAIIRKLSGPGHLVLYVLIFAVPALGALTFFPRGQPVDFSLFQIPPLMTPDRAFGRSMHGLHQIGAYILIGAVCLHVAMALWHRLVKRDGIFGRMVPGRSI
ncbi:cytochrome b [Methylovirgula sp. 4M-Z18]|uniref:cytochrome b n=1 Tax=Methylovirgula sp. 4M-Z18 TaxID=2293567 RepID=UPI000E2F0731|nr:cytochrome b [Methylovirgula sp. 4M-Z18]RFB80777.1 cytochrome b [Methylovirgula sp. 4M-Z18]